MKKEKKVSKVKKGQLYKENDKRFNRIVKVLEVTETKVQIMNVENLRKTWARIDRFGLKTKGYRKYKPEYRPKPHHHC